MYSTEAIPAFNVSEGWGVILMTFSEEIPVAGDIDNVPLEGSLAVTESLQLVDPTIPLLEIVGLHSWLLKPWIQQLK